MRHNPFILFAFLLGLLLFGCKKQEQETLTPKIKNDKVETTATTATFTWTVDWPGKLISVVEVSENEDMSHSQIYGSETETENHNFTVTVTDLKEATKYYYRHVVWNKYYVDNKFVMGEKSLTTNGVPVVATSEVSNIGSRTAVCGGIITSDGGSMVTERGICWSISHDPTVDCCYFSNGTGTGPFTVDIIGLTPNTKYYVRACAINNEGISYGNEVCFTTAEGPIAPTGAINGLFSVSASQQVWFSSGNLQYRASDGKWKFAEHQFDYIGGDNCNISQTYNGWIDLFGWGTSGWNSGAINYQPWSMSTNGDDYGPGGSFTNNSLIGSYANADWGQYNGISNGGDQTGIWRTLTGGSGGEWDYVFNTRITKSGLRYAKAEVANVNGIILLPDDWTTIIYSLDNTNNSSASFSSNVISATQWTKMENAGAVFLPAAGNRYGNSIRSIGSNGDYWSVTYDDYDDWDYACDMCFSNGELCTVNSWIRSIGLSVRLICPCQ